MYCILLNMETLWQHCPEALSMQPLDQCPGAAFIDQSRAHQQLHMACKALTHAWALCMQVPDLQAGNLGLVVKGLEVLRAVYCHARIRATRAGLLPPGSPGAGDLWQNLLRALQSAGQPAASALLADMDRVRCPQIALKWSCCLVE